MLSRIRSNGSLHALLALSMVLSSLTPYSAFADEKEDLQKQMESIDAPAVQHAPAPAVETQPPTTVADKDKKQFEQKDESKGLYETFVGENETPILSMLAVLAAYESQRLFFAARARADYQRDLRTIRSQFPSENGKPSVPAALAKQLEKIEELEKRMSEKLGGIQNRDSRIQAQAAFGDEICRVRLGMLAKVRETARPMQRVARAVRGGATAPLAAPAVPSGAGTTDEELLNALRADQKEYAQRYDEWRSEIVKYNEMVKNLSSNTTGVFEFKLPPESNQLMKVAGVEPDHRAMRDAINRVNRFLTRIEQRAMHGARPMAPVRAAQATWGGAVAAGNATSSALRHAGQVFVPSNWPGMTASAMRGVGSAIASGGRGTYGLFRHPILSLKAGMSAAAQVGGAAGSFIDKILKGSLSFMGHNVVRVALLGATFTITSNINSRLAEKDRTYGEKIEAIAKENLKEELAGRTPGLDHYADETFIYNSSDVWRQLNERKLINADAKANPFVDAEGEPVVSDENIQNMASARAEAKHVAKALGVTEFEGLWTVIYAQGMAAQGNLKAEDRPALLKQLYADHKAEIQALAVEFQASAGAAAHADVELKAKNAEIQAMKDAETARLDAEKKAAEEKAKAEEASRAAAAAAAAVKNAEAAKSKPPTIVTPMPGAPAPGAPANPMPEAKPAEAPKTSAPKDPSVDINP